MCVERSFNSKEGQSGRYTLTWPGILLTACGARCSWERRETLAKRSHCVFINTPAEGANAKSFISVHLLASGETINFAQHRTSYTLMAIDIFTRLVRRTLTSVSMRVAKLLYGKD
jgi:hypothetical protein